MGGVAVAGVGGCLVHLAGVERIHRKHVAQVSHVLAGLPCQTTFRTVELTWEFEGNRGLETQRGH